jgi:type II secretory pathway component PulF
LPLIKINLQQIILLTASFEKIIQFFKYKFFAPAQQQAFLEDIAMLVEDGVVVNQAVEIIQKTATGPSVEVATTILLKMSEGKPLAEGMRYWFSSTVVEILRAGEEGGSLAQSLWAAAATLGRRNTVLTSLANSLIYPTIVLCFGLLITVFMNHSVFVSFAAIKPIEQWPSDGRTVVALANFVQYGWWVVILALIGLIALLARVLRTYIGQGRSVIDQIPLLSLYRKLTAARFMETLGLLITNGVVFKKALRILQQNANPYLASHLLTMEFRLSGGKENIAEVLDTGLLDKTDLVRLRIIAQSKGFERALIRQGRNSADQTMKTVNLAGKFLGACLLTSGAGLAAYLVVTIYTVGATLSGF